MCLGTVVIPTFRGHLRQASDLILSIRETSSCEIPIHLILSKNDIPFFSDIAAQYNCQIVLFEELIKKYSNIEINADALLSVIGKFRFQSLKKLLGIADCSGKLALVLDSESTITKDLKKLFDGGIEETVILFSKRPWLDKQSLSGHVLQECNYLLSEESDIWFFENFNWLYDVETTKNLLQELKTKFPKWIFRTKDLFECQLYFQYAYKEKLPYKFVEITSLFQKCLGLEKTDNIVKNFKNSKLNPCGLMEYLSFFVSKSTYEHFVTNPLVIESTRLIRFETKTVYNISSIIKKAQQNQNFFGMVSMHRANLIKGKIAVAIAGNFISENDVWNLKNFLLGVNADLFIVTSESPLNSLIIDELSPKSITFTDDNDYEGENSHLLSQNTNYESNVKPRRDIGVMNMFRKINWTLRLIEKTELQQNEKYEIIIRVRPDIFSTKRLKDILLECSEYWGIQEGFIFFPNSFWSQGINDQFFFGVRNSMELLLKNCNHINYAKSDYLNPEYFLGTSVLTHKLRPITFDFKYILTRGHYDSTENISSSFMNQQKLFWSKIIETPIFKDQSDFLAQRLDSTLIKNLLIKAPFKYNCVSRKGDIEYFIGQLRNSQKCYLFYSGYKDPYVTCTSLPKYLSSFIPFLMKLGYPFAINKSEDITLISFDSNTQLLSFKKGNKDCDCELIRIRIGLLYWSLRCARNLLRIFINKTKNGIKLSWIIFKTFLKKVINYVSLFLK